MTLLCALKYEGRDFWGYSDGAVLHTILTGIFRRIDNLSERISFFEILKTPPLLSGHEFAKSWIASFADMDLPQQEKICVTADNLLSSFSKKSLQLWEITSFEELVILVDHLGLIQDKSRIFKVLAHVLVRKHQAMTERAVKTPRDFQPSKTISSEPEFYSTQSVVSGIPDIESDSVEPADSIELADIKAEILDSIGQWEPSLQPTPLSEAELDSNIPWSGGSDANSQDIDFSESDPFRPISEWLATSYPGSPPDYEIRDRVRRCRPRGWSFSLS